ncbi:5,6-dimethylbenzimidazole synthase [Sulfitobacter geojensis]|uniref:5,6-dimethylbenzimidazole synthase n=1 Tax=Sulfitobacter geojensis TaxID=1342299 RepID=UPI00046A23BC|nr:5,6-dimethylbenzimidazole synthase [Sulfitobacter geojensis]KHA50987.1 Cobalamin biosynthesis protein BluB [Sulfitobacter geojensis]NYI26645.1 5,6-dimethylbenzimidazole synthase [Sulfitobacter geojensis]
MDTFTDAFRAGLHDLMRWRRDVRQFRTDPVDEALLRQCLDTFSLAPSVGLSEPWRIVRVTSPEARAKAISNFEDSNAQALTGYGGDQAKLYASLKLSGMKEAPQHLAVYCDDTTEKGAGLGVASMPEMRRYSVVGAITLMWLTARSLGLGVGWVSVLDPTRLNADLDVPEGWSLVAYLCIGWPQQNTLTPELETKGWEVRAPDLHIENR